MTALDNFWEAIDRQLDQLTTATTADDVIRICCPIEGVSVGDGFFAGGGGDNYPDTALQKAGWKYVNRDEDYLWKMVAPNGDTVSYVEGDLYVTRAG